MNTLHFCSGLPRTGSTVLMSILQENPDIFTTGTCTLPLIIKEDLLIRPRSREYFQAMSARQADDAMAGLVKGATKGWYEGLTDKPVVISKSRTWSELHHLYPKSKYIVCIRDLRDICESFNKVNLKFKALDTISENGLIYNSMTDQEKYHYYFNTGTALSVSLHCELIRLMDLWKKGNSRVKFVRFEDLIKDPIFMLNQIYGFLNLNYFEHDLENINPQAMFEHDHCYFREKTDHTVNKKFISQKVPTRQLSNDFHNSIVNNYKWYYESFYPEVLNEYTT